MFMVHRLMNVKSKVSRLYKFKLTIERALKPYYNLPTYSCELHYIILFLLIDKL